MFDASYDRNGLVKEKPGSKRVAGLFFWRELIRLEQDDAFFYRAYPLTEADLLNGL
ncbi:MAG: hypothetical protein NZM43_06540 [Saprospiraceae bacterium]|nr:hypothetical protein [Saprospiraceae bacterium]MDW8483969.1 hypothetical protein [Saprospiraceae bacterium]